VDDKFTYLVHTGCQNVHPTSIPIITQISFCLLTLRLKDYMPLFVFVHPVELSVISCMSDLFFLSVTVFTLFLIYGITLSV